MSLHPLVQEFEKKAAPGQWFETLFASIPDAHFFVKNRQSQFIAANQGFINMLGAKSLKEILGKTDYNYSPPYLAKAFAQDDQKVIKQGISIMNKVELVPHNDLVPDWRVTSKVPVYDRKRKIIGLAGVTRPLEQAQVIYGPYPEMEKLLLQIRNTYAEKISIPQLAKQINLSVSAFERRFKRIFHITPLKYIKKVRLNAACSALKKSNKTLAQIAQENGFYDQSSMTREFQTELHLTPRQYRDHYRQGGSIKE